MNSSKVRRVHLVIDLAGSSRFWQIVRRADTTPPITVLPGAGEQHLLRTEQFPVAPVMAPGAAVPLTAKVPVPVPLDNTVSVPAALVTITLMSSREKNGKSIVS